jgi:hypothetical protein
MSGFFCSKCGGLAFSLAYNAYLCPACRRCGKRTPPSKEDLDVARGKIARLPPLPLEILNEYRSVVGLRPLTREDLEARRKKDV